MFNDLVKLIGTDTQNELLKIETSPKINETEKKILVRTGICLSAKLLLKHGKEEKHSPQ